jgi:putative transposase
VAIIDKARAAGESVEAICAVLEVTPRAYYRWRKGGLGERHGGGGGWNKLTPTEERRIVAYAKKHPEHRCRRVAYTLERRATAFVGKSKVAEVLKVHGLNHPFERRAPKPYVPPGDMLLHEPRAKNLVWGMDWTWVRVGERHMFLLVLLDWYSRKILAWGFFRQITSLEVIAVVTDAVAAERIDELPEGALKPRLVADHGSANTSKYTRSNIEVQGLDLWLSGVGRPTGNARTERVIGTLKEEEIKLQDCYADEDEALRRIGFAIWDYNDHRPNAGVGGFAPSFVHTMGRKAAMDRRQSVRGIAATLRYQHWKETRPSQGATYLEDQADL